MFEDSRVLGEEDARGCKAEVRAPTVGGAPKACHGALRETSLLHRLLHQPEALARQRVNVGIRARSGEQTHESLRLHSPGSEASNVVQEGALLIAAGHGDGVARARSLGHLVRSRGDAEAQQKRRDVRRQPFARRRVVDARRVIATLRRRPDATVSRPEMTEQQPDLSLRKPKRLYGNAFLAAALPEDTERAKPGIHAGGPPAIAVPAEQELVPRPVGGVASYDGPEAPARRIGNRGAVLLRTRRVAQRLVYEIAPVTDQMTEKNDVTIGPNDGTLRLGHGACRGDPIPDP